MPDTLRIKRRAAGGAAGAPAALANAELAYNEQDDVLYYGKGGSSTAAASIIAIAGSGAFPSKSYVDSQDALHVLKAGDTMTGALVLPGDPTTALQAATKQYVDAHAGTGGIAEAPSDGKYYTRRNAAWVDGATNFAPLASPVLTGNPTAPTPSLGDNDTSIATTAFVQAAVGAAGGGNVSNVGTPTNGQLAQWTGATTIQGINASTLGFAPLASPVFTGDPQAPTPATADNDTSIATTAFVKAQGYVAGTPAALTKTDDTNVTLTLGGTPATALLQATSITVGWTGTLPAARLNANVVQAVTNDTNVTGSIASQTLTLGWTGTLANARLANMNGHTYKGNNTASAAAPIDVTSTQLTADLDLFTSALKGLAPASGGGTTNFLRADGTWNAPPGGGGATVVIPNYLGGLTLSNDATSPNTVLDIATGGAMSDDNTTLMNLLTAITKNCTAAWAVGSGNGALDTGTIAANIWYHVFLIERTDTGVVDVLISTSATAPTLPTNYNKKRRIGSFATNPSSQIIAFSQFGDQFLWKVPVYDILNAAAGATGNAGVAIAITVPSGVKVIALLRTYVVPTGGINFGLSSPDVSDASLEIVSCAAGVYTGASWQVRTDTAGRVLEFASAATSSGIYLATTGWLDNRGK